MKERLAIHPTHPQRRLIDKAAERLARGDLLVCPSDCTYTLVCAIDAKEAERRLRRLRGVDERHPLSLLCRDLQEISDFAVIGNAEHRILRACTPGPYTFVLPATRDLPRRLRDPRRKAIGVRVCDHPVTAALLETHGAPLVASTLTLPGEAWPLTDPDDIAERVGTQIDLLLDAGTCGPEFSTVVALENGVPELIRAGKGDLHPLGLA